MRYIHFIHEYLLAVKFAFKFAITTAIIITYSANTSASSPWGADYFPNVALITHEGDHVRFFDDLIEDKVVVINFIYTSCPDTCPLETAQLTRVQDILGDRLGKNIFFYSITIDPEHDTVDVLKSYREKFGARWTFLTGARADIIDLRRKLGLYIEDNAGGVNNHNVNMIIGNQSTGRWMRRSPYENPHVLADQIGNWLSDWKHHQHVNDFAQAPALRSISDGEKLFRTRCLSCHTIDGSQDSHIGPDLLGVTQRRTPEWLTRWLKEPDKMLSEKDPQAMALYTKFNEVPMPNMRLSSVDISDLLDYLAEADKLHGRHEADEPDNGKHNGKDLLAIMNAWIREPVVLSDNIAGYLTLFNTTPDDMTLVGVASEHFTSVGMHVMNKVDGLMSMTELDRLVIPANDKIVFEPGSQHLMLTGPNVPVTHGQVVNLELKFASGFTQSVAVTVDQK